MIKFDDEVVWWRSGLKELVTKLWEHGFESHPGRSKDVKSLPPSCVM